jgi:hypothetical protein
MLARLTALSSVLLMVIFLANAQKASPKPLLKVEQESSGPFAGDRSRSCLQVDSEGIVHYAAWRKSGLTIVDKDTGETSHPEKSISVQHKMSDTDVWELTRSFSRKG